MSSDISWITNFIWGIADDVLRDLYVRGKYRDVILPMTVLRRLDAVLEPTSAAVVEMRRTLEEQGVVNQDRALRLAAGQSFYNTSVFTMRDLRARTNQQQLRADCEAYLDGFSPNVQEILDSFEFRHQIPRLSRADALGTLIEKFTDPAIDLSPSPDTGIDNHAMGSIFEELVRPWGANIPSASRMRPCRAPTIAGGPECDSAFRHASICSWRTSRSATS